MMAFGPKKDGSPNADFFQSTETLQLFDAVRVWLQKNCKKYVQTEPPTKESLSQLVIQLIQYQETKLGKNAPEPPFTRLPMFSAMTSFFNQCLSCLDLCLENFLKDATFAQTTLI